MRALAVPFLAGSVYHLAGLVRPDWTEPAPPWRHALFAVVNLVAAAGLVRWRRAWLYGYAVLAAQQVYTHGRYGLLVWRVEGRIDWASAGVLVFMPVLLVVLARRN